MHSETFRIPDDIPPSLRMLAEQFCSDAFRIRGVTLQTLRLEVCYLCRFFRHFGPPASSDKLFQALSPGSISDFLQDYARAYSSGSLAGMQSLLRSFLRFAHRTSRIERDFAELVPIRKRRQLGMVPRGLPDECIERLRSSIDRSTTEGMRDSAIICLLATYGVRGVQIRRLRLDDIDWPNERIQAIRSKKTDHKPPPSLSVEQVHAILDSIDTAPLIGLRDKALIQLLYNTGARVQEIAYLCIGDLRFEKPATVTLTSKGRKTRTIPLWEVTAQLIQAYLQAREYAGIHSDHHFLNNKGQPITRFGIGRRVELHGKKAAEKCPD